MNFFTARKKKHAMDQTKTPEIRSTRKIGPTEQRAARVENNGFQAMSSIRSQKFLLHEKEQDCSSLGKSIRTDPNSSPAKSTDRRLCSLRGAIVTFVLILVVILTTGIILGIVFGVINAQKNTSTTSAQNNQGNAITATAVTSALSSVSIGSQTGAPCSAYTTINDPTRSVTQVGSSGLCDDGPLFNTSNGGAWIRFVGTGGTIIPLSSVGMNHCGAFLSSWFNGTLPTAANVIQNGTVCFETSVNQCGWQFDMSVVFCFGSYYVYFLPPVTMCSARYCTV